MAGGPQLLPRWQSFQHAFRGIGTMLRTEVNARVHALATVLVVGAGLALGLARIEWLVLLLTIGTVWSLEAVNTAIESLCDVVSPERRREIEKAKDVAAAAVLIAAIGAIGVALLIFGPHLQALFAT